MSEWKEYKLGEIADVQTGPFGSQLHMSDYQNEGTPIITVEHLGDNRILHQNLPLVGDEDRNRLSKYVLNEGDIVFSRVGSVDRRAYVSANENGWMFSGRCLRVRPSQQVDSKYLSYYFGLEDFKETIRRIAVGATMPSINTSILSNVIIQLPPLDEQKQIASILSSLDDKIDLLNRENATLEAMAETLFRQWFIEEAKEDREEGTVSTFAEHYKESVNPQKLPATVFYHYSIPAFDNGKRPIQELGEEIQSNKYVIPQDCILFSKLNPHKDKRIWLMLDNIPQNAICSTEFQIIKPKGIEYLYFLYGWLNNNENYEEIASGVGGTSGSHQRIDPKSIFTFVCPYVDSVLIQKYNKVVEPMFYKQRENQKQIASLTEQRDILLPKLMSNEIAI